MYPSSPEKPLYVAVNSKVEQPKKVYFFQRENGEVIHTEERDAWAIYSGKKQTVGYGKERMKLIGTGEGVIFAKAVAEAQEMLKTKGLQASQDRLRKGIQEELEVAKTTIIPPRNFDAIGAGGQPVNIAALR